MAFYHHGMSKMTVYELKFFSLISDGLGSVIKDLNGITVPPRILIIFFGEPNFSKFLVAEFKIRKV